MLSTADLAVIARLETKLVWYAEPPTNWLRESVVHDYNMNPAGVLYNHYETILIKKATKEKSGPASFYYYDLETKALIKEHSNVYAATLDWRGKHVRVFKYNNEEDPYIYQAILEDEQRLRLPVEAVLTDSIQVGAPALRFKCLEIGGV